MHHSASKNGRGKPPGSLADGGGLGCNGLDEAAALREIIVNGLAHGWLLFTLVAKCQRWPWGWLLTTWPRRRRLRLLRYGPGPLLLLARARRRDAIRIGPAPPGAAGTATRPHRRCRHQL